MEEQEATHNERSEQQPRYDEETVRRPEDRVRIYGVPLTLVHDQDLFPLAESGENYPYYGVIYCGFRTRINEVRQPTQRLWYFNKDDVEDTGTVEDFPYEEDIKVRYYDLDVDTTIYEKRYRRVDLGFEISDKPNIFASSVAARPDPQLAVDVGWISGLSRGTLEALVASYIEGTETSIERAAPKLKQTYRPTRFDPHVIRDKGPGDIDRPRPRPFGFGDEGGDFSEGGFGGEGGDV